MTSRAQAFGLGGGLPAGDGALQNQRLLHLVADPYHGVQRLGSALEDHCHPVPSYLAPEGVVVQFEAVDIAQLHAALEAGDVARQDAHQG